MRVILKVLMVLFALTILSEIYFRFLTSFNEPYFDNEAKIIKRKKNTEGIYNSGNKHKGHYKINNEGWNSTRNYYSEKDTDIKRIAVIGHSNVEGLRISVNSTFSKILEEKLNENNIKSEVYTFGYGGINIAQALHISRYIIDKYKPDIILVGTMLDDFIYPCSEKKNFLLLQINNDNKIEELTPTKYLENSRSRLSFLYFSKTIKYLDFKFGTKFWKPKKTRPTDFNYHKKVSSGFNYIIKEFQLLSDRNNNVPIFFIKFPNNLPSYNYNGKYFTDDPIDQAYQLKYLKKFSFQNIDLTNSFKEDYDKNNHLYDFPGDYHYNKFAHRVIGNALAEFLQEKMLYD